MEVTLVQPRVRCDSLRVCCVWGCRASSEWLRPLPSWRSWKHPWIVELWMCRSTPPTRTPSQVNNTHTNALFQANFHNKYRYTLILVRKTVKKKSFLLNISVFRHVQMQIQIHSSHDFGPSVENVALHRTGIVPSSFLFRLASCSDIAVHFTH